MSAMHEKMHQWAQQENQVGEHRQKVILVLRPKKKRRTGGNQKQRNPSR
jgi:hypothetical protein